MAKTAFRRILEVSLLSQHYHQDVELFRGRMRLVAVTVFQDVIDGLDGPALAPVCFYHDQLLVVFDQKIRRASLQNNFHDCPPKQFVGRCADLVITFPAG